MRIPGSFKPIFLNPSGDQMLLRVFARSRPIDRLSWRPGLWVDVIPLCPCRFLNCNHTCTKRPAGRFDLSSSPSKALAWSNPPNSSHTHKRTLQGYPYRNASGLEANQYSFCQALYYSIIDIDRCNQLLLFCHRMSPRSTAIQIIQATAAVTCCDMLWLGCPTSSLERSLCPSSTTLCPDSGWMTIPYDAFPRFRVFDRRHHKALGISGMTVLFLRSFVKLWTPEACTTSTMIRRDPK